jgi:WD40 repeat protein
VLSVALTPDGQWVLSGSKDRGVQFWDPTTGHAQLMLQGHKNSGESYCADRLTPSTQSLPCKVRLVSVKLVARLMNSKHHTSSLLLRLLQQPARSKIDRHCPICTFAYGRWLYTSVPRVWNNGQCLSPSPATPFLSARFMLLAALHNSHKPRQFHCNGYRLLQYTR